MHSLILLAFGLLTPFPKETTIAARLSVFPTTDLPIEKPVVIHWDDHQIPFIEAARDRDLAFALGLIHAHLRLGQMEILRRVAQGRLSEMLGVLAVDIDRSLKILNIGRAVPRIEKNLPSHTRQWLTSYVAGINHYQFAVGELPYEHRALKIARESWTVADVLILGRLVSIDLHWLDWLAMLKLRGSEEWSDLWRRLIERGSTSVPSFRPRGRVDVLKRLLSTFNRWGSNSMVISARHSRSGAALIASDPHMGLTLPNAWLVAGYKSPSYHAVGLMFAGLPFIALGRNENISWGGTNMHAASSDLFDIASFDSAAIEQHRETVRVRWSFSRTATVRETALGPVLSDAPILRDASGESFALAWVGHQESDEMTTFLKVNRAADWPEFRAAFATYAVSGQNMLYADVRGNIGQLLAVRLPVRGAKTPADLILDPRRAEARWNGFVGSAELPYSFGASRDFLVSANNRPVETSVPIGYMFSTNDRISRISELLGRHDRIDMEDLKDIQRDVHVPSAVELRDLLVQKLDQLGLGQPQARRPRELVLLLRAWDGNYRANSRGALAFELLVHQLTRIYYGRAFHEAKTASYASTGHLKPLLVDDIEAARPEDLARDLAKAVKRAAPRLAACVNWGDLHRLGLLHPLGLLPFVARRYRFLDQPGAGSSETVMKTAHGSTDKRHFASFGASARHISDLSDLDLNFFVLLGGQDGWLGSNTFDDQIALWQERGYVQVPLRPSTVRATFRHRMTLSPSGAVNRRSPAD